MCVCVDREPVCVLPDPVSVVSERLVLSLPEDLRIRNATDSTFQSDGMTLGHDGVLQLLHERRNLVHFLSCRHNIDTT